MVKIKEGIYVRVNGIIGKIESISPDEKQIQLETGEIFDINAVEKRGSHLIWVIEEGDYVNGYKVIHINKKASYDDYEGIELDRNNNYEYQFIAKNKIENILTHEQYERNCYKVRS